VPDVSRKEKPGQHQREVFLFNDMLMVRVCFLSVTIYIYRSKTADQTYLISVSFAALTTDGWLAGSSSSP